MKQLHPLFTALCAAGAIAFFLHTPAQAGPTTKQNRWWTISGTGIAAFGDINAQIPIPRPACDPGTEPLIVDVKVGPIVGNADPDWAVRWHATIPVMQLSATSAPRQIYQTIPGVRGTPVSFALPAGQPPAADAIFVTVKESSVNPAVYEFAAHVTFACGVASVLP